jgi:hypothetical protein
MLTQYWEVQSQTSRNEGRREVRNERIGKIKQNKMMYY